MMFVNPGTVWDDLGAIATVALLAIFLHLLMHPLPRKPVLDRAHAGTPEEGLANARLIAAAPALLAALKRLEWWLDAEDDSLCPACLGGQLEGHKQDCYLRAAIALAEGGAK